MSTQEITYELAKQLKDAGFKFNQKKIFANKYDKVYAPANGEMLSAEYELVPSLSELIKACGDGFGELKRTKDGFIAIPGDETGWTYPINQVKGKTPEIAVALLWLKLNPKK